MSKVHPFRFILTTRYKIRYIRSLLRGETTADLLDLGCGSGFALSQMEGSFKNATGIDMSPEAIAFGQQFTTAKLMVGNAEKLPFKDKSFDAIVSTDAFEHIPDDNAAMREAFRVLRPGGPIVVYSPSTIGILSNTPLAELYHDSEKSYLLDQRYYTIQTLTELAEKAGFKVEYTGYHNFFIQEAFTQVLKWFARKRGIQYESQADIGNFVNSPWFPVYRFLALPVIDLMVWFENLIFTTILGGRIRGHRIVLKARRGKD
ncbi:MAG: class I SAM-dependent methyltransferase [Leptospirales bacterium]|nr:class I SAM-dependent methyltransferase [Leptospirales bacterium]